MSALGCAQSLGTGSLFLAGDVCLLFCAGAVSVAGWISVRMTGAKDSAKNAEAHRFACTVAKSSAAKTASCALPTLSRPAMRSCIASYDLAYLLPPCKNLGRMVQACLPD